MQSVAANHGVFASAFGALLSKQTDDEKQNQ